MFVLFVQKPIASRKKRIHRVPKTPIRAPLSRRVAKNMANVNRPQKKRYYPSPVLDGANPPIPVRPGRMNRKTKVSQKKP